MRGACPSIALLFVLSACGESASESAGQSGGGAAASIAASTGSWTGSGGHAPRCSVDDGTPEHVVGLSVGGKASLALTSHGRVACWGIADYGECGPGHSYPLVIEPAWIPGLDCIQQVDTDFTGFALDDAGRVSAWGTEFQGELGDGEGSSGPFAAIVPVLLPGPASHVVSDALGGRAFVDGATFIWGRVWGQDIIHEPVGWDLPAGAQGFRRGAVCELDGSGAATCRGLNSRGELGDGTLEQRDELVAVATDEAFRTLHFETFFTCGITVKDEVSCWGDNSVAQLGIGVLPPLSESPEERAVPLPTRLEGLEGVVMVDLAQGGGCALDALGTVKCWGENRWGRFAPEDEEVAVLSPRVMDDLSPARSVALGDDHVCVLRFDDTVWCRGSGVMRGFDGAWPDEATPMEFPLEEEP